MLWSKLGIKGRAEINLQVKQTKNQAGIYTALTRDPYGIFEQFKVSAWAKNMNIFS